MIGLQDVLVPQTGEDRRNCGLADLAAGAFTVLGNQLIERLDFVDLDDVEKFLSRVWKMLAEMLDDGLAGRDELFLQQIGDQRHAAAAAGASLGAGFYL